MRRSSTARGRRSPLGTLVTVQGPPGPRRGLAAVPRAGRRRHSRLGHAADRLVGHQQRGVERRGQGPRLVVAGRLERPGLRDLGHQPRRLQGALDRHLRQRLRRGAGEAGVVGRRGGQEGGVARHRADRRERRHPLHGLRVRRGHRQAALGARGAQGRAVRRPPSQEHLRLGDAGHRRRAPLRLLRQRRPVRLLARRQAAVEHAVRSAADVSRLRHGLVAGRPRRARLRAARQRRQVVRGGRRRQDRQGRLARRARPAGGPHRPRAGRRRSSGRTSSAPSW